MPLLFNFVFFSHEPYFLNRNRTENNSKQYWPTHEWNNLLLIYRNVLQLWAKRNHSTVHSSYLNKCKDWHDFSICNNFHHRFVGQLFGFGRGFQKNSIQQCHKPIYRQHDSCRSAINCHSYAILCGFLLPWGRLVWRNIGYCHVQGHALRHSHFHRSDCSSNDTDLIRQILRCILSFEGKDLPKTESRISTHLAFIFYFNDANSSLL